MTTPITLFHRRLLPACRGQWRWADTAHIIVVTTRKIRRGRYFTDIIVDYCLVSRGLSKTGAESRELALEAAREWGRLRGARVFGKEPA